MDVAREHDTILKQIIDHCASHINFCYLFLVGTKKLGFILAADIAHQRHGLGDLHITIKEVR